MKVFVAAPAFNDAQVAGAEKIFEILDRAKLEILPHMQEGEEQTLQMRLDGIAAADLVLVWLDGLMPPGIELHVVGGAKNGIQLQFPPPIQQLIDAGVAATGLGAGSLSGKRQTILLPGQVEQTAESPKGMQVGLPPNVFLSQFLSPNLNIPTTPAVFETGYAIALKKRVVTLQLGQAMGGGYFETPFVETLKTFEELEAWIGKLAVQDGGSQS